MTSNTPVADARFSAFLLGVATVIAQALLLRESMAAMGGSEMSWGVVMSLWLIAMAAGARLGIRHGSENLAVRLPIVVLFLAGVGTVLLRAAPAIIGSAPGETVTTGSAMWLWVVAVAPAAFAGGLAFPAVARAIGSGGRAYAFEAVGALVGGIGLSFALVHLNAAAVLCLTLGAISAIAARQLRSIVLALLALAAFASAVPVGAVLTRAGWAWSGHPGSLGTWMETRYQQILISDGPPFAVYGDGRLSASYPDPYAVLPRAHLLMLLHPSPRRVLVVGGVADGSIEAMAQHRTDSLTVVEEDPELLRALPGIFGPDMEKALSQPSVHPIAADPLRVIERGDDWDLILLLDGTPSTLRRNRTRTLEFLHRCRESMRPDGVLVMRVDVSDTYLGGAGGRLLSVLASTLRQVFEKLVAIPGTETFLVAGGLQADLRLDHETLLRRLTAAAPIDAGHLSELIPTLVDHDRSLDLLTQLPLDTAPNTIRQPRAVILAGGLHEARAFAGLLPTVTAIERAGIRPLAIALGIAVVLLLIPVVFHRAAAATSAGTVGFCSMGWWLLLIAAWQSTNGSAYSEIGGLTAVFMAGLAVGGLVASRWEFPERGLPPLLVVGAALSIALAAGLALRATTVTVPTLLAGGGFLTGAAFPGLTRLVSRDTRRAAGVAFAADEAGAAAAALVLGILVIPWAGLTATAWGLAIIQLAAVPAVLTSLRRC